MQKDFGRWLFSNEFSSPQPQGKLAPKRSWPLISFSRPEHAILAGARSSPGGGGVDLKFVKQLARGELEGTLLRSGSRTLES